MMNTHRVYDHISEGDHHGEARMIFRLAKPLFLNSHGAVYASIRMCESKTKFVPLHKHPRLSQPALHYMSTRCICSTTSS
jgi:hypothetical protein